MFRHYRVIFRELVFITSPSYISISIAAVGNTIYVKKFHMKRIKLNFIVLFHMKLLNVNCIANSCN